MTEINKWVYPEDLIYAQTAYDKEQLSSAKNEWIRRRRFRWLAVATWYVLKYPALLLIQLDADTERKRVHRQSFYANEIEQFTHRLGNGRRP